jgi:hypothetical protein
MKYFKFTATGQWSGTYSVRTTDSLTNPVTGGVASPSDVVLIEGETVVFDGISDTLTLRGMGSGDWTALAKENWLKAYLNHTGLSTLNGSVYFQDLLGLAEEKGLFGELSKPSIAYVTQDEQSGEVSIGMNVYALNFVYDYATGLPNDHALKTVVYTHHKKKNNGKPADVYVSAAVRVDYQNHSDVVYCFDGIRYDYDLSALGFTPTLGTGCGNVFGEVKLAGNGVRAQYAVKRNVDENDPTLGLISGEETQSFCTGEAIHIIDTTIWTKNNAGVWTWKGDFDISGYTWHVSDITNPCHDFRHNTIDDFRFPIRAIDNCVLGSFGYNITAIRNHFIKTDIVVHIDEPADWLPNDTLIISDLDDGYFHGYGGAWTLVSKGTDSLASNASARSVYFKLRRADFDNRLLVAPPVTGQIYRNDQ